MTQTAAPPQKISDREFCQDMLPKVSRTFAVCITLLPQDLEHSVLIAYLLCRVADTLEDSPVLLPPEKTKLLDTLSRCLDADGPDADSTSCWHGRRISSWRSSVDFPRAIRTPCDRGSKRCVPVWPSSLARPMQARITWRLVR